MVSPRSVHEDPTMHAATKASPADGPRRRGVASRGWEILRKKVRKGDEERHRFANTVLSLSRQWRAKMRRFRPSQSTATGGVGERDHLPDASRRAPPRRGVSVDSGRALVRAASDEVPPRPKPQWLARLAARRDGSDDSDLPTLPSTDGDASVSSPKWDGHRDASLTSLVSSDGVASSDGLDSPRFGSPIRSLAVQKGLRRDLVARARVESPKRASRSRLEHGLGHFEDQLPPGAAAAVEKRPRVVTFNSYVDDREPTPPNG
mmetsp:Transcript_8938/g.27937  ORF Transcript_8938/g.27937 Transcript_8938/m.27937 type:complete len:262 (+) Transcript_8938:283-1068(+)